jgi:hypothetical protein
MTYLWGILRASARADGGGEEDEQTLREAGLSIDGTALLAFFHARARTDVEHEALQRLLERFVKGEGEERVRATAELLGNGNTFIATNQNILLEVDRKGKTLYRINNISGGVLAAYRMRQGPIVCLTNTAQCLLLDTTGKILKEFHSGQDANCWGGFDVLANGHILVAQPGFGKIVEFDKDGKKVREVKAPFPCTATQLPNGHILSANRGTGHVFEVDRAGKIVWEYRSGPQTYRIRRR